jgi:HAD superfamily hydrolase (TIGR01509 family)
VPTLSFLPFQSKRICTKARRLALDSLSNTNALHEERVIRHLPWFSLFDQVTVSHRVGAMKPDPRIFHDALHKFGGNPAAILYLDDNSYRDIAGILGITETNVATKINRLKLKIKEQFTQNNTDKKSWNSTK